MLTALWQPSCAPDPDSLPAWPAVASFAGLLDWHDQPKKKPWAWDLGLLEVCGLNRLRCA